MFGEEAVTKNLDEDELEYEHYRTGGYAVIAMGGIGALWFVLTVFGVVGTGFIDATGIALISVIFVAVGGLMVATAQGAESGD